MVGPNFCGDVACGNQPKIVLPQVEETPCLWSKWNVQVYQHSGHAEINHNLIFVRGLFDDIVFGALSLNVFWRDLDETTFLTQNCSWRRAVVNWLFGPLGRWEFAPYDRGHPKILLCVRILGQNWVVAERFNSGPG